MKFGAVPVDEAAGKILAHKLFAADGRRLFNKGHLLTESDVLTLCEHGYSSVIVAALAESDLSENEGARRVAQAVAGAHTRITAPGVGRANVMAQVAGPLRLNIPALHHLNNIDEGITIATLREHTLVQPGQLLALIKIIPFGVAAARIADVEAMAQEYTPIISVRPLQSRSVGLILSGQAAMLDAFCAPTQTRIDKLGSRLDTVDYTHHTAQSIANVIRQQTTNGRELIIIAGISATIDREDVIPSAIELAGGSVAHFGVPVDPGSLLVLGYLDQIPVIGAPGCIKSLKTNVVDMILPRLLAGERLTRADLVVMGHGGLLDDISERPMPRETEGEIE